MCTLIVAHQIFDRYPIVVAANRDEQLARPSEPPARRDEEFGTFSPLDLQRGGTWIGINAFGVFAGLTNRMDIKSRPGCRSRGEVVMKALRSHSAEEAFHQTQCWDGQSLNGFNLVIADPIHLFLIQGDGQTITRRPENHFLIATNQGVGRGVGRLSNPDRSKRVNNILDWAEEEKIFDTSSNFNLLLKMWINLLEIHDGINGTCIFDPEASYGTKSSSIISLSASESLWHYWHRERINQTDHICIWPFDPSVIVPLTK